MKHFNTTPLGEMQPGEMQFGEMQLSLYIIIRKDIVINDRVVLVVYI